LFYPGRKEVQAMRFLKGTRGQIAEKAVVMFAIIVAAYAAYRLLGNRIAQVVRTVASFLGG